MLIGVRGNSGIIFLYEGNRELGISQEEGRFLRVVMQSEGLVINADGSDQNNLFELTAKGYSIARSPGGSLNLVGQSVARIIYSTDARCPLSVG